MIYGNAIGPPAQSVQIPALAQQARESGIARYIGRGLNRWSNVHIADVAALYALAIAKAPAGSFMYVESGEEALGEVARAIAARLGLGAAQSWPAEQAIAFWGRNKAMFSLGWTYALQDNRDEARRYLKRYVDAAQGTAPAHYLKAAQDRLTQLGGP
jgi:nucleoside-diphosphate-sugar epimerase